MGDHLDGARQASDRVQDGKAPRRRRILPVLRRQRGQNPSRGSRVSQPAVRSQLAGMEGAGRTEQVPGASDRGGSRQARRGHLRHDARRRGPRGAHRVAGTSHPAVRPVERARREHLLGDPRPVHRSQQGSALQVHPRVQESGGGGGSLARAFAHPAHRDADHPEARDGGARRRPVPLQAQGTLHILRHHQAGNRDEEADHLYQRFLHRDRPVSRRAFRSKHGFFRSSTYRRSRRRAPNGSRSSPV